MNHPLKLIVGLGNPGAAYVGTRHNAGENFVEMLAESFGTQLKLETKYFGRVGECTIGVNRVRLLVPETFMNRSGRAIVALAGFYKILPQNILVAYDELDIDVGAAKLKFGGGHGGHNGLRDTISHLGNSRDFYRLRIGIGHPGSARMVSDYVLSRPSLEDRLAIEQASEAALKVIPLACKGAWNDAMKQLHTKS